MSLMERMKRSVPKIDPWSTLERTGGTRYEVGDFYCLCMSIKA